MNISSCSPDACEKQWLGKPVKQLEKKISPKGPVKESFYLCHPFKVSEI